MKERALTPAAPQETPGTSASVLLDPDVAQAFKDSESVNRALRLLLDLAKREVPQTVDLGVLGISNWARLRSCRFRGMPRTRKSHRSETPGI